MYGNLTSNYYGVESLSIYRYICTLYGLPKQIKLCSRNNLDQYNLGDRKCLPDRYVEDS